MKKIGLNCPKSKMAHSLEEAIQIQPSIGFPIIIRPSFTLGEQEGALHIIKMSLKKLLIED